jgi:hypothetical protein
MRRHFSVNPKNAVLLAAICAAGLVTGCSPETAKSKGDVRKVARNGSKGDGPVWNWEAYPPMNRMRVAQLPCQLQPKSTIAVVSPISGLLRIYAPSPQSDLKAGFLWGEFEPEILKQDEVVLLDSFKKLEDLERVQWEIEYPRKKMEMEQRLREAEKELRRVEILANDPVLARKVLGAGSHTNAMRPETLDLARETYRLAKQQYEFLQSTNFAALGFDLTGQRTEWKRRELEFQRRRQQSRFEMPFDGKLTVSVPISEGVTNYPVNQGQELAVARDISSVRARVVMDNAAWTGLSPDKMRIVVTTGGRSLEAKFIFQKIEKVQNREESAFYFEFPREKSSEAARLIGANNQCELWVDLTESVRIVPKLAVILHQPDAFQNRNWQSGISTAFPGARLVLEGQTDLAITVPTAQAIKSNGVNLSSAK